MNKLPEPIQIYFEISRKKACNKMFLEVFI